MQPSIQPRHRRTDRYQEPQGLPPAEPPQEERPPREERPAREVSAAAPPSMARLRRASQYGTQQAGGPSTPRSSAPAPRESEPPRRAPAAPPPTPAKSPIPKALRKAEPPVPEVPVRPERPAPKPQRDVRRQTDGRMPTWISVCIVVGALLLGAMFAAQSLMQAYLVTKENERQAAYQAVVDAHPLSFRELIEQYSAENNLRPAFVEAIILNESSYRTDAESNVGARGLMQLMPDTAEWIARKLKVSDYAFARMYDAESNIQFGTWYLGYLSKLFRGDPVLVACAYHAGQGEVAGWLSDSRYSADGVSIPLDSLPDGPTKTYAGRVTRDYGIYERLYYEQSAAEGDGASGSAVRAGSVSGG